MFILSISENILLFISAFGMLQGILLAAILYFHPRSDRSVTTFLALYICCLSIPILMPVAQQLLSWQFIFLIEPFILLIGPFLYLYIRSFKEVITWRKAWPHFFLFLVYVFFAWWQYTQVGSKYPVSATVPEAVAKQPQVIAEVSIRTLQRLIYYFLSFRALKSYQRSIQQLFSETSRINLHWVKWLINGNLILVIAAYLSYLMILKYPDQFTLWVLLTGTIVSIYIYLATFKGITQTTLWQIQPGVEKEKVEADMQKADEIGSLAGTIKRDTGKQALNDSKVEKIVLRINDLMEQDKLYQEPELTLQNLADKIQFPSYQVSQAINEGMKKNFYDLINSYRIEEAKRLLLDPKNSNYTILSVGFEAGFNSKTTFNTVFKKFTGLTPTEYRDSQR